MSAADVLDSINRFACCVGWHSLALWTGRVQIAIQFPRSPTREDLEYLKRWCEFEMQQLDGEAKISSLVRVVDGSSDGSVGHGNDTIKPSSVDAELAASPRDQPWGVSGSLKAPASPVLDGVDDAGAFPFRLTPEPPIPAP
jgi:hypothetical protein